MRVIFLNRPVTILLTFILWGIIQVAAALICLHLPDRFFAPDSALFRSRRFEQEGTLYLRVFAVHRWKHLLPDGGAAWKKKGFQKKRLDNTGAVNLNRFLVESARGEMTHWLAILPFWVFGFFTPGYVLWMMLAYALVINLPCIIVQRYNRPRIHRLLRLMNEKGKENRKEKREG